MMTVVKDEWVRSAMTDDKVVVELLVRLKHALPAPKSAVSALKWGIRQPRSRPVSMRCEAKRDGDFSVSTRGSPTTPLSWSGGGGAASPSAANGFEETSRQLLRSPPQAAPSRSKVTAVDETISTTTKRTRRKKTFTELKEEAALLLKERVHLEKEIASMRATCKEERAKNENLKRIKLDFNLPTANSSCLIGDEPENDTSSQPHWREGSSLDYVPPTFQSHSFDDHKLQLDSCSEDSLFLLPDLNAMPVEDD